MYLLFMVAESTLRRFLQHTVRVYEQLPAPLAAIDALHRISWLLSTAF